MNTTRTKMVGARLNDNLSAKLDWMAKATARSKSSVIRLLIYMADVGDNHQIRLGPPRGEIREHTASEASDG
jgi:hypothetical protein